MKTLNDRIVFVIEDEDLDYASGTYPYQLKRYPGGAVVFSGNFYYDGVSTSLTFDVTDILASDGFVIREDDFNEVDTDIYTHQIGNKLVNRYYIIVTWDSQNGETSSSNMEYVAKVYKYRNRDLDVEDPFFNTGAYEDKWTVTLQGKNKLTPHYPMYAAHDEQANNLCPFGINFLCGNDVTALTMEFRVSAFKRSGTTTPVSGYYSYSYITNVGSVALYSGTIVNKDGVLKIGTGYTGPQEIMIQSGVSRTDTSIFIRYPDGDIPSMQKYCFALINYSLNKTFSQVDYKDINEDVRVYADSDVLSQNDTVYITPSSTKTVRDTYIVPIMLDGEIYARFDVCPKKYYLFWQDRYGSFQCQAFNDHANYSEKFDRVETKDFTDRRRYANIQVQPKWSLDSGWIKEDLYPYYESIYTSPILILFDVERNERINVLVTGDYVEKTYRNQKKMINMNLELEENKKQNIIY